MKVVPCKKGKPMKVLINVYQSKGYVFNHFWRDNSKGITYLFFKEPQITK